MVFMHLLASIFILLGSLCAAISVFGVLRNIKSIMVRQHILSLIDTGAVILVGIGLAMFANEITTAFKIIFSVVALIYTSSVVTHIFIYTYRNKD